MITRNVPKSKIARCAQYSVSFLLLSLRIPVYLLLKSAPLWVLLAALLPVLVIGLYVSGALKAHDLHYLKGLLSREPAAPGA